MVRSRPLPQVLQISGSIPFVIISTSFMLYLGLGTLDIPKFLYGCSTFVLPLCPKAIVSDSWCSLWTQLLHQTVTGIPASTAKEKKVYQFCLKIFRRKSSQFANMQKDLLLRKSSNNYHLIDFLLSLSAMIIQGLKCYKIFQVVQGSY